MKTCVDLILFNILFVVVISSFSCKKEEEKTMMVRNDSISDVSYRTAKATATIIDPGEGIEKYGHCWSTNAESITIDTENKTENGAVNTPGSYSSILTNLSPGESYYVRAYVLNGKVVVYGNDIMPFTTLSMDKPVVTTGTVTNITASSAKVSANLDSIGAGALLVIQHGHCWSSGTLTPTIENDYLSALGSRDTTGSYESELVGLSAGTLYYVRAYATNEAETAYGETLSFSTDQSSSMPTVITADISSVTATSAESGGDVTSDEGVTVTACGVCWSTSKNPTLSDSYTTDGSDTGSFTSNITGLSPNTTYYVRAYATNNTGTAYGNQVSFTTSIDLPTVITTSISSITEISAQSGGTVTSDGGASVIAYGVCWSTSVSPTLSDNYTTDGSGTGQFISYLTGLSPGTTYYVRAYATNNAGTAYGEAYNFETDQSYSKPTVITAAISSITSISAESGGNVTSDGGATVTAYGICWSTSENPTLSDSYTTDGSGTGQFISILDGLSPNTTYYIRAYAINSAGIAYGNELVLTTNIISWQKSLGGSSSEYAYSIQQTTDGGYIIAGFSGSNDGDVTGNQGFLDYWIVKLTSTGDIDWQKSLGGNSDDRANSIQQTTDGGYIIAGYSGSNDGDVTGNHGMNDCWIVKLTSEGVIDWQKSLGGSNKDQANSIQQTTDGGYIIAGFSGSNDGDVTGNHGSYDYWVVKLTSTGDIEWEKSLGGSDIDQANSIQQTTDGSYIIAGFSYSNDGDVSGNHGGADYWIVKLTSTGDIDWQMSLGGSGNDLAKSVQKTVTSGNYIIAGYSNSNDGDVSGNHGERDYWIVLLISETTIYWQKSLGGSGNDFAQAIQQTTEGGFIIAGYSDSNDGDISGNNGDEDAWIVKLTIQSEMEWQKSLGGLYPDGAYSIQQTTDGGYIIAGYSNSNDGDVSGNHGVYDCWVLKIY